MKLTHCTGARGSEGVQVTSPLSGFIVTRRSVEMVRVGTERAEDTSIHKQISMKSLVNITLASYG